MKEASDETVIPDCNVASPLTVVVVSLASPDTLSDELSDTSPSNTAFSLTNNPLLNETSSFTNNLPFNDKSSAIINV